MLLKTIKFKTEKDGDFPSGTLRVYLGNQLVGRCIECSDDFILEGTPYSFQSCLDIIQSIVKSEAVNLERIRRHVEESLTAFLNRIINEDTNQ